MRVFVLGAGASLHAGYPLARRLGQALADWVDSQGQFPTEDQAAFDALRGSYSLLDDFELVLTKLIADEGECAKRSLRAIQVAIRGYFDSIRSNPAHLYARLAQDRIRPGPTWRIWGAMISRIACAPESVKGIQNGQ